MTLTRAEREALQAGWFEGLRSSFLRRALVARRRRLLDLGCGTGVVTRELVRRGGGPVLAIDKDPAVFSDRAAHAGAHRILADAASLPLRDGSLELAVTQMLFMWLGSHCEPVARELRRVLRPSGLLLAVAEPDFGGALDHPPAAASAALLEEALSRQGADTRVGRRLPGLLAAAGFRCETAVHGGSSSGLNEEALEARVALVAQETDLARAEVARLRDAERQAVVRGERFLFVPYVAVYATRV